MRALVLYLLLVNTAAAQGIPWQAWEYREAMTESAWQTFGPDAPVALLAAQIHQESGWNCNAVSWAKAKGCAQFTDATAAGMARNHPEQCAPVNQYDPGWSWRCSHLLLLDTKIKPLGPGLTECDVWAFKFRWYNGGPGVERDRKLALIAADNPDDWKAVEPYNAGRKKSAWIENTEYPVRIFRLEFLYQSWGNPVRCAR